MRIDFVKITDNLFNKTGQYIKIVILFIGFLFQFIGAEVFEGYTIFTQWSSPGGGGGEGGNTYLMDHNSTVVKSWSHTRNAASMPYLLPDSSIIYPYRVPNPYMNAGGVGGGIQRITWDGTILWNYFFSDTTYQHHHDIEPLPSGNVLIIVWEAKTAQEAYDMGRQTIDNPLNVIWSEAILELNPITGNIDWEWHLWDHLIQDVDSSLPNYGVVSEHPELFDINNGTAGSSGNPGGGQGPNGDWMHLNAINYNAELDQIVISSAKQSEILIMDHSTTTEEAAGHTGGNSGKGGDLLYRWGNPQNYDRGNNNDHILGHQHGINWIHEGSPGAGNLILFNNHHNSNTSGAVIEIETPIDENGSYFIEDGEPWGPESFIMVYNDISTQMQGGAFRQPNGNTLITDCDDAHIFEINVNGSTQWEYNPSGNYQIPRAQKYGLDYFDQASEFSEIYDVSIPENDTASYNYADFRMWVNDSTDTLRGIYWFMHPDNGDSRNIVNDSNYQTLASSQDFALMGAHIFNMNMQTGIGDAVIAAMDSFAVLSSHDEISFIPFFINGYSWGGQFGYHFTKWIPERVLGFITQKGGYHDSTDAGGAMEVPGLMFVAENDLPYRIDNLTGIFLDHRPLGAKWMLAMEQGVGHTQVTDYPFLDSFFNTVADLRLPDSMDVFQPVTLNPLPDSMGWLGDQTSWTIGAWDCYDGAVDSSSWFPTREVGELWQNFVSEGWVSDTSECDGSIGTDIRIPAEWETQEAIWLQWPLQFEHWIRPEMAATIATIQNYEPVHLIVENEEHQSQAETQIQNYGGNLLNVSFHIQPHNNAWLRDNGPLYVEQDGNLIIHDMEFDSWGGLVEDYEEDDIIPSIMGEWLNLSVDTIDFIMERGNLEFNGAGTLITNWDCWADRNPDLDQDVLDIYLKNIWGLDQIVWTYGHSVYDVTTGHIDGVARFVDESTVVVGEYVDSSDEDAWIYDSAAVVIENAGFEVVRIDMPGYIQYYGFIIPAIYINWIQVNGAIIGNLYNVPEWDSSAQNFLEELFPDYDVILLFTPEVNISGGGIHCITNDQPQQTAVSIEDKTPIPMEVTLHPAYPNPFNPSTTLRYDLPEKTTVNIIIYDMLGRQVKTVVNTTQEAGFKSVIWDATNSQGKSVSAGVYFYQIQVGGFVQTRKMVLLK